MYDYLIVGGGAAGCVLANRLSANPANRVLLLEAGDDTYITPPEILDGNNPFRVRLEHREQYFWPGLNIKRTHAKAGLDFYEQGRVLGGGSSVNVLIANRGLPRDYDNWQGLGAEGWDWQGVLPYFKKLESDVDFTQATDHGANGPLPISRTPVSDWSAFTQNAVSALEQAGFAFLQDQNSECGDGYFSPTANRLNGERYSAARAYLTDEVRARKNLLLITNSEVSQLILDGNRVLGVEVGGAQLFAREVILSAGAIHSPTLLLKNGIGPAEQLAALGITPRVDLPGVGQNLWDHTSIGVVAPITEAVKKALTSNAPYQLSIRASSGVDAPSDLYFSIGANAASGMVHALMWINTPSSKGALTLDANQQAQVDFNLLSDGKDLARLRAGLELIQRLFNQAPLAQYGLNLQLSPFAVPRLGGPALDTLLANPLALNKYLLANVDGVWHASGTCKMGRANDPLAVVDNQGRVYGSQGLRVVDASIMPVVPTANTHLPTLMLAEKISDLILENAP